MSLQDHLLAYSDLDRQQRALCAGLDGAARRLLAQKKKNDQLQQEEKELHTLVLAHKAKAQAHAVDAAAAGERIDALRLKMNDTRTNNEYQALLVEVGIFEKQKAAAEEASLESTGKAEETESRLKDAVSRVADHAKIMAQAAQDVADARTEIGGRLTDVLARRDAAGKALPQKVLELCQKLADRLEGDAVCCIEETSRKHQEYICQGCSIKLPRQMLNALLNHTETPTTCPSCSRLLVLPADLREALLEGKSK